jgi:hypothetical protein
LAVPVDVSNIQLFTSGLNIVARVDAKSETTTNAVLGCMLPWIPVLYIPPPPRRRGLTALDRMPASPGERPQAQARMRGVAVRAAARCSTCSDALSVILGRAGAQRVALLAHAWTAWIRPGMTSSCGMAAERVASPCARHRPSIGSVGSCAARVEIDQNLYPDDRVTRVQACAIGRTLTQVAASQPPHVLGEARRAHTVFARAACVSVAFFLGRRNLIT